MSLFNIMRPRKEVPAAWILAAGITTSSFVAAAIAFSVDVIINFSRPPRMQPVDLEAVRQQHPHLVDGVHPSGLRVRIFEGFDPYSSTLVSMQGAGMCLEPEYSAGTTMMFDCALPVRDGDLALVEDARPGAPLYRCAKWIERTDAGTILHSNDGPVLMPVDPQVRIRGRLVQAITLPEGVSMPALLAELRRSPAFVEQMREVRAAQNANARRIHTERRARRAGSSQPVPVPGGLQ